MHKFCLTTCAAGLLVLGAAAQSADKPYKAYVVANAHFDTQWVWDVQTSIRDFLPATMDRNFYLLEHYPDYLFNFEGAVKYAWMREYYPDKYEKVKDWIKTGRWHVSGSSWDANDPNMPSPESFIRNVMLGQNFYKREFGLKGVDVFLPDCFGFGWTLPAMASHCGLIGFSTQKLMHQTSPYRNGQPIPPFNIGLWEGIDGSRIMAAPNAREYYVDWDGSDLSRHPDLIAMADSSPIRTAYHYYGIGDRGGSPDIESARSVARGVRGDGPVQVISAASDQLFLDYLPFEEHPELPVYNGEMLMDVHATGCYTSQAAMKLYNRKNELLADAAEKSAVMADWLGGLDYPGAWLTEAWQRFVWHQFHDDLTGTSIDRAYEFSWNDELLAQQQFAGVLTVATGAVARGLDTRVKGTPILVYNAVSEPVADVVEATVPMSREPRGITVYDGKGRPVPTQLLGYRDGKATLLFAAEAPAVGYAVYDLREGSRRVNTGLRVTGNTLENAVYRVELDRNGDIASIVDKRYGRELVAQGKAVRLALFTPNKSYVWPAWELFKETMDAEPVAIDSAVRITVAEDGDLRVALCVERERAGSKFRQYIRLSGGGQQERIDIVSEVDWHTKSALLKAEFPLTIANEQATYDLGIGSIRRGTNTAEVYEVPAQQWADLTDAGGTYGVSVINDSKHGWDKPDGHTLRLTLLHTPDPKNEDGDARFGYQERMDHGYHTFTYSIYGHEGGYVPARTTFRAEAMNQPLRAFVTGQHAGPLGRSFSFAQPSTDQVRIKALKKAENGDFYVVRLYEMEGRDANDVEVTFPAEIVEAFELNGIEEVIGDARHEGNKLVFSTTAFRPKTFGVRLKPAAQPLAKPSSRFVDLPYNMRTATFDPMRYRANIDGEGYSYAAELLPDTIDHQGILYRLGDPEMANGVRCAGDTIRLGDTKGYNKLYILAAATRKDTTFTLLLDGVAHELAVPYYSGFIGQWGHTGHTEGFYKDAEVAWVGTHRHQLTGNRHISPVNRNAPYEFTYMFRLGVDLPVGAGEVVLPDNRDVVIFAATLADDPNRAEAGAELVTTGIRR
ncbi:MAG: alpha-mannosidase [Rikenellaceae bacterium]|nr:alpha-mannosidase [Rikenellaceae bacterium]